MQGGQSEEQQADLENIARLQQQIYMQRASAAILPTGAMGQRGDGGVQQGATAQGLQQEQMNDAGGQGQQGQG
ncbi:unnamed protein product, partial [Amoebophrya sp. A25]